MNAIADSTGIILDIHVPPNGETWGTNTVSYLFQFYEKPFFCENKPMYS